MVDRSHFSGHCSDQRLRCAWGAAMAPILIPNGRAPAPRTCACVSCLAPRVWASFRKPHACCFSLSRAGWARTPYLAAAKWPGFEPKARPIAGVRPVLAANPVVRSWRAARYGRRRTGAVGPCQRWASLSDSHRNFARSLKFKASACQPNQGTPTLEFCADRWIIAASAGNRKPLATAADTEASTFAT